jgi:hypothetical protein
MPGWLLQLGATVQCAHGGSVMAVSTNTQVSSPEGPLTTWEDSFLVAGCTLTPPSESPCLQVQWLQPATRVFIDGVPAVLTPSASLTDGTPPAPAVVVLVQTRVWGI